MSQGSTAMVKVRPDMFCGLGQASFLSMAFDGKIDRIPPDPASHVMFPLDQRKNGTSNRLPNAISIDAGVNLGSKSPRL
jgi:hypothetical protein